MATPPPEFYCTHNKCEMTEDRCIECRKTGQKVRDTWFYGSKSPFATREDCKLKHAKPLKGDK